MPAANRNLSRFAMLSSTTFQPVQFATEAQKEVYLCMCKHKKLPYCGSQGLWLKDYSTTDHGVTDEAERVLRADRRGSAFWQQRMPKAR